MPAWRYESEKELAAFKALKDEADRSAAIIAATFVEDRLTRKLKANLRDDTSTKETARRELFRSTGPLGVFATKIRMGFMMRFYGGIAYKDLTTIKEIRNKFAHSMDVLSFQTTEIVNLCKNLKIVEHYVVPTSVGQSISLSGDPVVVNGRITEEESVRLRMHSASLGGLSWYDDPSVVLDNPRERFLTSCSIFMGHFSYVSWRTAPFRGDDMPPPLLEIFPVEPAH